MFSWGPTGSDLQRVCTPIDEKEGEEEEEEEEEDEEENILNNTQK